MNQIADVYGFNLMNNLRLVIVVAIFIGIIIVLLLNRFLGSRRKVKRKYMQAVNPYDDSSREERNAPGVVDDFSGMEESMEKEKSKGGKSAAESEVEIENPPVVNYEKIEADLKAIRDEVTTRIEGLILKVEAVEKDVLNKIEDAIDVKIQEASNKINDKIAEVLRTQKNSITSVSEERVDFLYKEEIKGKEQTDTIAPPGDIKEKVLEAAKGEEAEEKKRSTGETVDFDIQTFLEELGPPPSEKG